MLDVLEATDHKVNVEVLKPAGEFAPWLIDVSGGINKQVPVYNLRNDTHHEAIARHLSGGEIVAIPGGCYALTQVLDDPRKNTDPEAWKRLFKAKTGRDPSSKFPSLVQPKNFFDIIDYDQVHPEALRLIDTREKREALWRAGAQFHIIGPVSDRQKYIHPALVTTPDDLIKTGKKGPYLVDYCTASVVWPYDLDWQQIADRAASLNPRGISGVTSFNDRNEEPAYIFEGGGRGVIEYITAKERCPIDAVVRDPIGEWVGVESSHTQIRIPRRGEQLEWVLVRRGAISPQRWLEAIDSPFGFNEESLRLAPYADRSSAKNEETDVVLDSLVFKLRDLALENFGLRHPRKGF